MKEAPRIISHAILPEPFVCSDDFRSIMDMSLRKVADVVIEDLGAQVGAAIPPSRLPLAKLLTRVAQLSSTLLEEPSKNKHIQTIPSMPEVLHVPLRQHATANMIVHPCAKDYSLLPKFLSLRWIWW